MRQGYTSTIVNPHIVLKTPKKFLKIPLKFSYPKNSRNRKFQTHGKKSFDHPLHLKSGEIPWASNPSDKGHINISY